MAMRLKGRAPHPDWPVPYPYEAPKLNDMKTPNRQIDDVENYLIHIITKEPFSFAPTDPRMPVHRPIYELPYIERHVYVHEPDPEVEGDVYRTHPAVWVPPQVRGRRPRAELEELQIDRGDRFGVAPIKLNQLDNNIYGKRKHDRARSFLI